MRPRLLLALLCAGLLASGTVAHAGSASRVEVSMQQFAFAPATVTVAAGATIVWTNRDSVPHSVTSADGAFDSGPIEPGKSFEWTANQAAAYHCTYHPSMTGSIQILSAP